MRPSPGGTSLPFSHMRGGVVLPLVIRSSRCVLFDAMPRCRTARLRLRRRPRLARGLARVLLRVAQPAHQLAHPPAHLLDRVRLSFRAELLERRPVRLVLEDPFAGELPGLDLA